MIPSLYQQLDDCQKTYDKIKRHVPIKDSNRESKRDASLRKRLKNWTTNEPLLTRDALATLGYKGEHGSSSPLRELEDMGLIEQVGFVRNGSNKHYLWQKVSE